MRESLKAKKGKRVPLGCAGLPLLLAGNEGIGVLHIPFQGFYRALHIPFKRVYRALYIPFKGLVRALYIPVKGVERVPFPTNQEQVNAEREWLEC